ncbi:MAG: ABC transporter substrate-binding protein [Thermotogae bacterium]|nr:ABC transporter substrate-binding protein [Thermotogota bacterium]
MSLRTQNLIITVVNLILAAILVVILVQPGKEAGEIEVKVATVLDPSSLPFWVAEEKGFFKDVGIKYKPNEVPKVLDEFENTISGSLYASFGIDFTYMLMKTGGDMKLVRLMYYVKGNGDGIVVKDTTIKSVEDLAKKRIGYYQNTRHNVILDAVLPSLLPKDTTDTTTSPVEIIGLSLDELDVSLDTRRVDALYLTEPYLSYFRNREGYRIIAENVVFDDGVISGTGITSAVNVSLRKKAIERMKKALRMAMDYIEQHPDEAKKILANRLGMSMDIPNFTFPKDASEVEKFAKEIKERQLLPLEKLNLENIVSEK